jgi:hypothetical protein
LPEALKLLDVRKELEDLSSSGASSDAITTDHFDDSSEETSN